MSLPAVVQGLEAEAAAHDGAPTPETVSTSPADPIPSVVNEVEPVANIISPVE